ncbi:hypothetical protein M0R72_02025 [Candidatus Pacearchaeota archaeon]|jgi:hypothetical protein|nr:hypothetical protein [Candidatus Pacearchaeota archaeon]
MAFQQPSIVNRSATKPIYIIVVEDPSDPEGIALYKSQDVTECNAFLEFRGIQLTKTQAAKATKDPHATIIAKTEIKQINRKIPWHRVIRMDHITYNKTPQGETNDR